MSDASIAAAVVARYAAKTSDGQTLRCAEHNNKVVYETRALADAAGWELRSTRLPIQESYPCPMHQHFHLTTDRNGRGVHVLTEEHLRAVAVCAALLARGNTTRGKLMRDSHFPPAMGRRFRHLLGELERARAIDCEGELVFVRNRSLLVQVSLTGVVCHG